MVAIANAIAKGRIDEAEAVARAAVAALMIAAKEYPKLGGRPGLDDFRRYMHRVAELLVSARPAVAPLPNSVAYVLSRVDATATDTVSELIDVVCKSGLEFIEMSKRAAARVGVIGAKRVLRGEVLLTHYYSAAAISVILEAHRQGKVAKVYSTEARPGSRGRAVAKRLASEGVEVVQVPDSAVWSIMTKVDRVVLGAHLVTSDGFVVGRVGTSQVALAAKEARVEVMVAAETYKFSPATAAGLPAIAEELDPEEVVGRAWLAKNPLVRVLNPAFDVTPPSHVDVVITELGVIPPRSAAIVLRGMPGLS